MSERYITRLWKCKKAGCGHEVLSDVRPNFAWDDFHRCAFEVVPDPPDPPEISKLKVTLDDGSGVS